MSNDFVVPAVVRQEELPPGVYSSRFGYHPCSYKTYLKICFIKYCYWQAVKRFADWKRWKRKRPENRLMWVRVKDVPNSWDQVPRLEPNITEIVKLFKPLVYGWIGGTTGFGYKELDHRYWAHQHCVRLDPTWCDIFLAAKMPMLEARQVVPFKESYVLYIDQLFEQLGELFPTKFVEYKLKLAKAKR